MPRTLPFNLSLFPSITPPPPRSTLFPYTTLFRSQGKHRCRTSAQQCPAQSERYSASNISDFLRGIFGWDRNRIDRKSTRLNSSHVAISYAVFCLKKKSKYNQAQICNSERQKLH